MGTLEDELMNSGVSYHFRYVGNIQVATSMRSLDFNVRTQLTKECIYRVCHQARLVPARKVPANDCNAALLLDSAVITLVGVRVDFVISTRALTVVHADTTQPHNIGQLLLMHPLPAVSFASAGDPDMPDYVCYVAKDDVHARCCFVYECGQTLAVQVLKTIGDAFNIRHGARLPLSAQQTSSLHTAPLSPTAPLISFESTTDSFRPPVPEYVNDSVISAHHDTINFSPLSPCPPSNAELLSRELWYHGRISRDEARRQLRSDGDFLVRQSTRDAGQFVLSGMQNGVDKHLLLIDDKDRKVRTKDREFQNVSHLIQYHRDHRVPITSEESALLLLTPISRQ